MRVPDSARQPSLPHVRCRLNPVIFLFAAVVVVLRPAPAGVPAFTEGKIQLRTAAGGRVVDLLYQLKDGQLRIERPGGIIPAPPVNLLDIKTGTLRILRPHNSTWQEVPAADLLASSPAIPGLPGGSSPPLPGVGPRRGPDISPPGQPGRPPTAPRPSLPGDPQAQQNPQPAIGPDRSRLPRMPDLPSSPAVSGGLPPGIGPQPGGNGNVIPRPPDLPQMPGGMPGGMPGMFPGEGGPLELKASGETRSILGYECEKHTLTVPRRGEMTLWLAGPGLLPPFHLLHFEAPRPQGRTDWRDRVLALLREQDRFPLLAVVETDDGSEIARWEVTGVEPGEVADPDGSLFQVPATFHKREHR